MKVGKLFALIIALVLSACSAENLDSITESTKNPSSSESAITSESSVPETIQTGLIREQIFEGAEGEIHYSYYAWTELDEEMIVISAQFTDWHEKSARQANELTQYFIDNFAVDTDRIYAAGYSAGGETMSRAVALHPDIYAAYLHGASQWDGEFVPIAENGVAVYIYMAENDEYYGSQKARDAYDGLYNAYKKIGFSDNEIAEKLRLEIPDNEYFNLRGIYNYHGGANIVFDDENVIHWIIEKSK